MEGGEHNRWRRGDLRRVFAGSLIIGTRAVSTMAEVGFAAGGTVAAADYDQGRASLGARTRGLEEAVATGLLAHDLRFCERNRG